MYVHGTYQYYEEALLEHQYEWLGPSLVPYHIVEP